MRPFSITPNEISSNRFDIIYFDNRTNYPRILITVENQDYAMYLKSIFENIYGDALKDAIDAIKMVT